VEDWRECRNEYVELGVTRESELRSYRPILLIQVVYIKGTHESYDLIEESPFNSRYFLITSPLFFNFYTYRGARWQLPNPTLF
jgi:hypothetical protein